MHMLFDPARHEALDGAAWDATLVRAEIEAIVRETLAAYSPTDFWPTHPLDLEPGEDPALASGTLYFGATGVIWALHWLRDAGALPDRVLPAFDLDGLRAINLAWLAAQKSAHETGSYLMGQLPIEMLAFADSPTAAQADVIAALIEGNLHHPARELLWGSPGSLLAAAHLHATTQDERWAVLFRRLAAQLERELKWSDAQNCHYWQQDLYGQQFTFLGGGHGVAGSALALSQGRHLLPADVWQTWTDRLTQTLQRTAHWEAHDGNPHHFASWRVRVIPREGVAPQPSLVQFCHGAPGVVMGLAEMAAPGLDALLIAGGETIWAAGPLTKGAGFCHGTVGNGQALLQLYQRTGNVLWLQRAQAFAMHAIGQARAHAAQYGQRRHSLWTGDLGLATCLWDCVRASEGDVRPGFVSLHVPKPLPR